MIDYKIKFILIFLLGVVLSFILTKLVMLLARKLNILDHPTRDRKIHSQATPLLGGWAIYGSFALIVLLLWQTGQLIDQQFDIFLIGWLLIAGLILMINGF